MKILWVCSRETDYLQELTYAGLAEILGKEKIADFPRHWQYHQRKEHFFGRTNRYPGNLGYGARKPVKENVLNDLAQAKDALKRNEFSLAVLASAKPDALKVFAELEGSLGAPWIFIDGGDRKELGGDFLREGGKESFDLFSSLCCRRPPELIFKRELAPFPREKNIFPLPFSVNTSLLPEIPPRREKKFQVLFWAVESSETRKKAFELLKGRYDCDENGTTAGKSFKAYRYRGGDYLTMLNQSEIGLSFRGEGFDTLRYWEVPLAGALLVSEEPSIEIPNNFRDKKEAVFCRNDLSDLTARIDHYLAHPGEARAIARAGQAHLLKYHTHKKRAETILGILKSELGFSF